MIVNRNTKVLLVALFLAAIWLPLTVTLLAPPAKVSEVEKRQLAEFPALRWDSSLLTDFPREFENYYNDHFGLRRKLIHWFNRIQVQWLGISVSEQVLVGRKGWLFQNGVKHVADKRNTWPLSPGMLGRWSDVLSAKHEWLKQQGIDYLFVIAPSKHTVYPEFLPNAINQVYPISRADQLVDHLRAHSTIPLLDLRPRLRDAKKTRRVHHLTDTHWNDYGAYVGYREIVKHLNAQGHEVPGVLLAEKDFIDRVGPGGDLAQMLDMRDELTETYIEPARPVTRCAESHDLEPEATDTDRFREDFTTTCLDAPPYRLLVFRDSYALALMPYLSESFAHIRYVPSSPASMRGMKEIVREYQPDIVIEERASRWLRTPEG